MANLTIQTPEPSTEEEDLVGCDQISRYLDSLSAGMIAVLVENSLELQKVHKIILKQSDTFFKIAVYDPGSSIDEHRRSDILGIIKKSVVVKIL